MLYFHFRIWSYGYLYFFKCLSKTWNTINKLRWTYFFIVSNLLVSKLLLCIKIKAGIVTSWGQSYSQRVFNYVICQAKTKYITDCSFNLLLKPSTPKLIINIRDLLVCFIVLLKQCYKKNSKKSYTKKDVNQKVWLYHFLLQRWCSIIIWLFAPTQRGLLNAATATATTTSTITDKMHPMLKPLIKL